MAIQYLILHHSASLKDKTTAEHVNEWHRKRNWGTWRKPVKAQKSSLGFYSQYGYIIERNGAVVQCRKDDEISWHSGDWDMNTKSIGICLLGNFDKEKPDNEQIFALRDLLKGLAGKYNIPKENILGHNEVKTTRCPGKEIKIAYIRTLIKAKEFPNKDKLINKLELLHQEEGEIIQKLKEIN